MKIEYLLFAITYGICCYAVFDYIFRDLNFFIKNTIVFFFTAYVTYLSYYTIETIAKQY
jgi:hypothetical protein